MEGIERRKAYVEGLEGVERRKAYVEGLEGVCRGIGGHM